MERPRRPRPGRAPQSPPRLAPRAPLRLAPHRQASTWFDEVVVCDTVKCGETATFSMADGADSGLTCAGSGGATMADVTRKYKFTCAPAANNTPCSTCASATQTGDCVWKWAAPTNGTAAAAVSTPPSTTKCRCTTYRASTAEQWLCGSFTSCPGAAAGGAMAGRRRLLAVPDTRCPAAYNGSAGCWIVDNWSKIMDLQGRGAVGQLLVGAGDRTVGLDLEAIKCACTAWSVSGKAITQKAAPA